MEGGGGSQGAPAYVPHNDRHEGEGMLPDHGGGNYNLLMRPTSYLSKLARGGGGGGGTGAGASQCVTPRGVRQFGGL